MKKRNLFTAFLMLLITAVALTTSSYAWFSVNSAVQVDGLDINVEVAEGIQVSTDAATWKAQLSLTDISTGYSGHTNQLPTTLRPVSTIGSQSTGNFEMFNGEIVESATTTITTTAADAEVAGTTGDYVAFDLFIQAVSVTPIYLHANSGIVYDGTDASVGLEYTTRIAFFNQGTDGTSTPATARALANGTSSTQVIWEPYATEHTTWALGNGATADTKHTYYGIKAAGTGLTTVYSEQADDAAEVTPVYFDDVVTITPDTNVSPFGYVEENRVFTAGVGITKVRVYIWVEGQDIDTENSVSLGLANDPASSLIVTIQLMKEV
jgi:hypothetical protein